MENLAPIAIFIFNRPEHTEATIKSLLKNPAASQSEIYVFADGPRPGMTELEFDNIAKARMVCRNLLRKCNAKFFEHNSNLGLAENIISGINHVFEEHDRIIVLEDDLDLSDSFLNYMNWGLDKYAHEDRVYHVSGYWFPVKRSEKLSNNFFLHFASCWGWGTWKRAWKNLETDPQKLKCLIQKKDPGFKRFNCNGYGSFLTQLDQNISGEKKTWAIKWYSTIFLNEGLSLHPNRSYVNNIGHDGSGENCGQKTIYDWKVLETKVNLEDEIPITFSDRAFDEIVAYYKAHYQKGKMKRILKKNVKKVLPNKAYLLLRKTKNKVTDLRKKNKYKSLKGKKRFTGGEVEMFGKKIRYLDGPSFYFMFQEIFNSGIYKMNIFKSEPYIIDAGANIGLASIYLRSSFPNANIIAFEPDEKVSEIFEFNLKQFENDRRTKLVKKCLWSEETTLSFYSEGADGGRVKVSEDTSNLIEVKTQKLSDFITKTVDFLKLDIEGAEYEVLKEIENRLHLVDRIFLEYHSFSGKEQVLPEILSILKNAGFRLNINTPGLVSNSPFYEIRTYNKMDMQLNIYGQKP